MEGGSILAILAQNRRKGNPIGDGELHQMTLLPPERAGPLPYPLHIDIAH